MLMTAIMALPRFGGRYGVGSCSSLRKERWTEDIANAQNKLYVVIFRFKIDLVQTQQHMYDTNIPRQAQKPYSFHTRVVSPVAVLLPGYRVSVSSASVTSLNVKSLALILRFGCAYPNIDRSGHGRVTGGTQSRITTLCLMSKNIHYNYHCNNTNATNVQERRKHMQPTMPI